MTCILHLSSAKSTKRKKHKLHTFAKQKVIKQQLTNTERQKEIVSLYLRKWLLAQNGLNQLPTQDQYLELPRAIADANRMPHKSEERNAREFLHERYVGNNVTPFSHQLVSWCCDSGGNVHDWKHTLPRMHHEAVLCISFGSVCTVQYYVHKNVAEIHIVFDHANRHQHHPKQIERTRQNATCVHNHTLFHN